ncbi:putative peptide hydrolase SCDLUD_002751 [Saccharomycodes ludwigii]|uniref:putative peptide hydrolase n=1 Tax=Saccharomycodes ludwigii TaxID=36035 RepID=UPI001E8C4123|nr:hypothetical protein SCDLUD_002751 [Saccharomycodes ludwigii]KAH3901262.1 hypothetical protein SCDLUD_002751 [Saccharomycodes ludwigii]
MCGRYALSYNVDQLPQQISKYKSLNEPSLPKIDDDSKKDKGYNDLEIATKYNTKSYNIAPTKCCPILLEHTNEILLMRWGLIPAWSETPVKYNTFNARIESLNSSKIWKTTKSKNYYCAVPMSGYYEWHQLTKQPYYVRRKDEKIMFVAGLYEIHEKKSGEKSYSFTIVTSPAPKNLEWLHLRMPVIIEPGSQNWESWFKKGELHEPKFDDELYECYPVTKSVGNVKNDNKGLIVKVENDSSSIRSTPSSSSSSPRNHRKRSVDVSQFFTKSPLKKKKN